MKIIVVIISVCALYVGSQITPHSSGYESYLKAIETQPVAVVAPVTLPGYCQGYEQVCDALVGAGFQGDQVHTALAIGRAESGLRFVAGDQSLANGKWGWSYGPWQIRSLNALKGTGQCRDLAELQKNDWGFHARCAYEISAKGTYWKPWSVYLSGAYKQHL